VHRRLFHVDLGAACPHHHEAIARVPLLEGANVGDDLFGEVSLAFSLLDVGPLKALDVPLIEYRRHGADGFQFALHLIEL
jgi:hypothetical protein